MKRFFSMAVLPVYLSGAFFSPALLAQDRKEKVERTMAGSLTDQHIETTAKRIASEVLGKDEGVTRFAPVAYKGSLLLLGQIPDHEEKESIVERMRGIEGVKEVYDELTLEAPLSLGTQSKDAWITGQVKTKLMAEKGLKSMQAKVVTENGVVYLLGKLPKGQQKRAREIVQKIDGVHKVVPLFENE